MGWIGSKIQEKRSRSSTYHWEGYRDHPTIVLNRCCYSVMDDSSTRRVAQQSRAVAVGREWNKRWGEVGWLMTTRAASSRID